MSRINSYDELLAERRRLEVQISEQKLVMKEDIRSLKLRLEPFLNVLPVLNIFRNKKTGHPLLSTISSLGIDLLGQTFLSKTSWITKFILPLIAKGFTSRAIRQNKVSGGQIAESA